MKKVCVGLVGSGYAAFLHGNGYKKVSGILISYTLFFCNFINNRIVSTRIRNFSKGVHLFKCFPNRIVLQFFF